MPHTLYTGEYMERYNLAFLTKKIYDSNLTFFTAKTLRDILGIEKESSLFKLIARLTTQGVIAPIERNKYLLANKKPDSFALANFLYQPSYISCESALNFFGILSQFPYETVSVTLRKTAKKIVDGTTYSFLHIKKELFWGYEKQNHVLLANPEKAIVDQLYFAAKGLRSFNDNEYDLSRIDKKKLKSYVQSYPLTRQFQAVLTRFNL